MRLKYTLLLFCLFTLKLSAQDFAPTIHQYLQEKKLIQNSDFIITSESKSTKSGLFHVYIQQTYQGIKVEHAVGGFHFNQKQELILSHQNFIPTFPPLQIQPKLTAQDALISYLQKQNKYPTQLQTRSLGATKYLLTDRSIAKSDIPMELCWVWVDSVFHLAWDMSIQLNHSSDWWSLRIDAQNGKILEQNNWTLYCPKSNYTNNSALNKQEQKQITSAKTQTGAQYNVFAIPTESPNHGSRSLLVNPQDSLASPYGWHDLDGDEGADMSITEGNNVYAYEDTLNLDSPGYSPDGGLTLNFNFPLQFNHPPTQNIDASLTNLFYINNIMHDVWYHYGFDESNGNFQYNNYARGGSENDYVLAEGLDGGGTNNANFATPPDGQNPRMQMYLWEPSTGLQNLLTILPPSTLAGSYSASEATFGPSVPYSPLTAEVVLAIDNTSPFNDICSPITNISAVNGKIALIDRGTCTFVSKVTEAQNAGAVAVIIINNTSGQPITMGGTGGANISIPVIMVSQNVGNTIKTQLNNGQTVMATLQKTVFDFDCDFDNGVIAHEYGHGISNRLTGGRMAANCLNNDEQMGEGWSDWFALMLTMKAGEHRTDARGMATYVSNQPITGAGIREAPYSTDFSINNYTYGDIASHVSMPHGVGFVWATMLWEMTWDLIDQYGYNPDLYTGTGGNNMAMQLVIEGLKLQPCSPGFVDGRNAILAADQQLYGGANQCLIWKAFARRGLGALANQGSSNSRTDQTEDFSLPSSCLTTSVENLSPLSLHLSPNPSIGVTQVNISQPLTQNLFIQVFNAEGKIVYKDYLNAGETEKIIKLPEASAGVYAIQLSGKSVHIAQKWIVIP